MGIPPSSTCRSCSRRRLKVRVDADVCTGHGRCYASRRGVRADDFGHCEIPDGDVPRELEAQARTGRDNCPELAISIEEYTRDCPALA